MHRTAQKIQRLSHALHLRTVNPASGLVGTTPIWVHRRRGPRLERRGQWLGRGNGFLLKFPDDGRTVRFGRGGGAEESATVIILPVIRIERYETQIEDAEPYIPPPAQNGGRRRVRRR